MSSKKPNINLSPNPSPALAGKLGIRFLDANKYRAEEEVNSTYALDAVW